MSVLLGQDNNYDLLNYHVYNGYSSLVDRSTLDILPAQIQTFLNPLLDILLLILMSFFKPLVLGFVLAMIQAFNYFLMYKIAQFVIRDLEPVYIHLGSLSLNISGRLLAFSMGLAALLAPASLQLLGTSHHDNLVSIPILTSILVILHIYQSGKSSTQMWLIAGFAAGVSLGLKLTVAIYILATGATVLLIRSSWLQKAKDLVSYGCGLLGGMLLSGGFWFWNLWVTYGNPIFPWFNNIFRSPEMVPVAFKDLRYAPKSIWDVLLNPVYLAFHSEYTYAQGDFRDLRFLATFGVLLILAAVLIKRNLKKIRRPSIRVDHQFLILFFVIAFMVWVYQFSIYRYAFALEAVAVPVMALGMMYLLVSRRMVTIAIYAFIIMNSIYMSSPGMARIDWQPNHLNAHVPEVPGLEDAVVVLGGNRPSSFLLPGFPQTTRFIRFDSNMHPYLTAESSVYKRTRQLLSEHTGYYYLISWQKFLSAEQQVMERHALTIDTTRSWHIANPHEPELTMWKLERKP